MMAVMSKHVAAN